MPQVFPETAPGNFTWCEEMHRHVLTTFYPYQWDLNYHNPKVFNEMIGNILYLANMGVEVFRIDAVPYIWKELGTNCRNLPQVHSIGDESCRIDAVEQRAEIFHKCTSLSVCCE